MVEFYAKWKGRTFRLKRLGKREDVCKNCPIKDRRCGNEKAKTSPCDDIYFALDRITDDYKLVEVKDAE